VCQLCFSTVFQHLCVSALCFIICVPASMFQHLCSSICVLASVFQHLCFRVSVSSSVFQHLSASVFQLLCSSISCACSINNRLPSMTTLTICVISAIAIFPTGGVRNNGFPNTAPIHMSDYDSIGPPPKTAYHLGGVRNSAFHEKNHFFLFFYHFFLFHDVLFQNGFWEN
jgi:hypothetical protein